MPIVKSFQMGEVEKGKTVTVLTPLDFLPQPVLKIIPKEAPFGNMDENPQGVPACRGSRLDHITHLYASRTTLSLLLFAFGKAPHSEVGGHNCGGGDMSRLRW